MPHPNPLRLSRAPRRVKTGGFALLITITLLAFLVLLLVSLASLTRVETQVATNNQQISQARQNALMALNLALGQLQKTVGLDQRTTARADMASATNVNGFTTLPKPGQGTWVSAWGNGNAASYADLPGGIPTYATTGSVHKPVLLNWLVSGNETATFTGTSVVSAPSTPKYAAGAAMSPATLAGATVDTAITIGGDPAQLLVGPQTVDSTNADTDYVVAPSVAITAPAGSIPGLTTAATVGRYAYWIGDEGMKARINLQDNYTKQTTTAAQDAARFYSYVITQRSGVEVTNKNNTPSAANLIATAYLPESTGLASLINAGQLPLLGSDTTTTATLTTAAKFRYHDFTVSSSGVLADSYAGGLKKNLTAALASAAGSPADTTPLFTPANASDFGLPTWSLLRNYAQTTMTGASTITSAQQSTLKLYPVITYAAIGVSVSRSNASPSELAFNIFPIIGLWNPYNFALPATTYEVGFGIRNGGKITLLVDGTERAVLDLGAAVASGVPAPAVTPAYFRFRINAASIGAGNTPLYGVAASASASTTYDGGTPITLTNITISSSAFPGYAKMPWSGPAPSLTAAELAGSTLETRNAFSGGSYFEAALTPSGALSGVSNFTPAATWYHTIQKVGFLAPGSSAPSGYPATASATVKLAAASAYPTTPTTLPYVNLRIQAAFEGHHSNVYTTIGFPSSANSNQWFRWLANANPRAAVSTRTKLEDDWMGATYPGNTSYGGIIVNDPNASTLVNLVNISIGGTAFNKMSAGLSHDVGTYTDAKIFGLLPSEIPLLSIGQLQHAPLSISDAYPAYPLGNSWADYRLARTATQSSILVNPYTSAVGNYYDLSWHLNRSLLDRYFVSSAPSTLTAAQINGTTPLPNARMIYQVDSAGAYPALSKITGADAYDQTAANLMVAGSFNVNSTSAQAWQAVLTGTNNLDLKSTPALPSPFTPTFARMPIGTSAYPTIGSPDNMGTGYKYQGNRRLAVRDAGPAGEAATATSARAADIAYVFAQNIVAEIKKRGPFLSIGDFVNRRLINNDTGIKGTLQAAIDATKPASTTVSGTGPYGTDKKYISVNPVTTVVANTRGYTGSISQVPAGSEAVYQLDHVRGATYTPAATDYAPEQNTGVNSMKFLSQADILSSLAPALSARSDTFVIRTYGEAINPVTGASSGRAWCEAVVQRTPQYVDTTSTPNAWDSPSGTVNPALGRRFKVVSFRWLSASDI